METDLLTDEQMEQTEQRYEKLFFLLILFYFLLILCQGFMQHQGSINIYFQILQKYNEPLTLDGDIFWRIIQQKCEPYNFKNIHIHFWVKTFN